MAETINLALNLENRRQLAQVLHKGKNQSPDVSERNLLLGALNWFEMERTNLLASVEWSHQAEARELVILLAGNLVNFFNTCAYWADWERTHLLALEATRELGDRSGEAQTLINLGNVHSLRSNWEKANSCYEQGLGIFSELGNCLGVAKTLGNLGNVYVRQSLWGKADECYKQSLLTFTELKDRYGEAQTLANMGIVYAQQGNQEKAVAFWQGALTKLPSDLPKTKRLAEWIQSNKGTTVEVSQTTQEHPASPRIFYIIGGVILVAVIALFLLVIVSG
jgi:tetratricopeptide (TPR) repeat protein